MSRLDAERSVRHWLAAAAVFGQVAATAAGVLRPAFLPLAAIATVVAAVRRSRPEGVWAQCSAVLALAIGVGVVMRVAESRSATTSDGLSGMLSTLTLAL